MVKHREKEKAQGKTAAAGNTTDGARDTSKMGEGRRERDPQRAKRTGRLGRQS
jgi:hypothetical protein